MGSSINATPQNTSLHGKMAYDIYIGLLAQPVRGTKKPTNNREAKNPYRGKLDICPDHPHCQIKIQFGMVGGLQVLGPFQVSSKLAEQLPICEGSKSGLLHYFRQWFIQQPVLLYK